MPQKLWAAETSGPTAFLTNRTLGAIQSRRRLITYFCFTKIILLHTGIGTPSPAERGTSNEKQQTTSNGGETEKNGNKERKQNETADRRCGTGSISDKEDDGEEDVNKPQMEVEYDKGQEDSDAKSNSQVQTNSGFTTETHLSEQTHQESPDMADDAKVVKEATDKYTEDNTASAGYAGASRKELPENIGMSSSSKDNAELVGSEDECATSDRARKSWVDIDNKPPANEDDSEMDVSETPDDQKPASSETLWENYNTTQCSTEDNGKLTAQSGNNDVCDGHQRSEDRSLDDLYKEAADKVKERLSSDGNKCANNSVVNYLRFYTREEELSEYFCLTCNEGLWS